MSAIFITTTQIIKKLQSAVDTFGDKPFAVTFVSLPDQDPIMPYTIAEADGVIVLIVNESYFDDISKYKIEE